MNDERTSSCFERERARHGKPRWRTGAPSRSREGGEVSFGEVDPWKWGDRDGVGAALIGDLRSEEGVSG